ncbi:hypothetical protein ACI3PL_22855, partial [Lacticaseibacillus paracasei]
YYAYCMNVGVYHRDDRYRDITEADEDITTLLRNFAEWIYSRLESEYRYQVSDNTIIEYFNETDCEFTENGKAI